MQILFVPCPLLTAPGWTITRSAKPKFHCRPFATEITRAGPPADEAIRDGETTHTGPLEPTQPAQESVPIEKKSRLARYIEKQKDCKHEYP